MDMKRILQALDNASTKPVEGANDIKKALSIVTEGANPHKVALPVQMAMQHYQSPVIKETPKQSLLKQYFQEAEEVVAEELLEKKERLRMYSKQIAERVLMKESNQKVLEDTDPNKLLASATVAGEFKEFDLTPLIIKNNWVGDTKAIIKQADQWISNFLDQRGLAYSNLTMSYKGLTLRASQTTAPVQEAPIEPMDDPNDPVVYGHEKANPMSLKGRIASARAQLKELAQMSESDDLVTWERITQLHKGGMFMGLAQNLEQIRHGIEELASKRRKGGVQSRGIDKNIGEDKQKGVDGKACWDGYKRMGTKKKGGKTVDNCVPTGKK